jgi:hypothetical protein
MVEEWKCIEGFLDYQVSNLGRIKSFKKHNGYNIKILKLNEDVYGYLYVNLYRNKLENKRTVHRLVLLTFKPILNPNDFQINHIDGNKKNNNTSNLEWCTGSENILHAFKIGLINKMYGLKNPSCKLTKDKVIQIRFLLKEGILSQLEIGKLFGVSQIQISRIKLRKNWKDLK